MKIVTSFCAQRISRQQACLDSWKAMGLPIVAVQSVGEPASLAAHFQGVEWVETDKVADAFDRPACVRISALMDVAETEPVLVMNSDIGIRAPADEFRETWTKVPDDTLQVGIRHDHDERRRWSSGKLNRHGIDVFRITPQMARDTPDIGMAIGCPGWDYYLPIHMHRRNYRILARTEPHFFHAKHHQRWSMDHYTIGVGILSHHYGLTPKRMARFIQQQTGR